MQTLLHITTVQPFLEKIKQIGLSQHFERWRAVQDSFMCVDGATGGGGGISEGYSPRMPSSLWLSHSLSSLLPLFGHSERGNGNGRERKHTRTTLPLCLTLPVCRPVSFPVWSVQPFDQSDFRLSSTVLRGYLHVLLWKFPLYKMLLSKQCGPKIHPHLKQGHVFMRTFIKSWLFEGVISLNITLEFFFLIVLPKILRNHLKSRWHLASECMLNKVVHVDTLHIQSRKLSSSFLNS